MVEPDESESALVGTGMSKPPGPPGEPWLLPTFSIEGKVTPGLSVLGRSLDLERSWWRSLRSVVLRSVRSLSLPGLAAAEGPEGAGLSVERDLALAVGDAEVLS